MPCHKPLGSAEATLRAGLRLIPEIGATTAIYSATRLPANTPVQRISRSDAFAASTVVIRTKAIKASAQNAAASPRLPGNVAMAEIGGRVKRSPKSSPSATAPAARQQIAP